MYILEPGIRNWHWGTSIPLFGWPRYCWLGIHSNAKRYSAPRNTSSRNVLPPSSVLGGNRPPCSRISLPLALSLTPAWSSTRGGRGGSGGEGRARKLRRRRKSAAAPAEKDGRGSAPSSPRRHRASPAMDAAVELPPRSISHLRLFQFHAFASKQELALLLGFQYYGCFGIGSNSITTPSISTSKRSLNENTPSFY